MLILGGAFVAGVAAVVAGLKAFGGSVPEKVGGAISDQFGPFPVRSVETVPDIPPERVGRQGGRPRGLARDRRPRGVDEPPAHEGDGRLPLRRGLGRGRRALGRRGAVRAAGPGRREAGGEVRGLPRLRRRVPEQPAARPDPGRADDARRLPERRAAAAQARRSPSPGRAEATRLQERQVGGAHRAQRRDRDRVLGGQRLPGGRAGPGQLSGRRLVLGFGVGRPVGTFSAGGREAARRVTLEPAPHRPRSRPCDPPGGRG